MQADTEKQLGPFPDGTWEVSTDSPVELGFSSGEYGIRINPGHPLCVRLADSQTLFVTAVSGVAHVSVREREELDAYQRSLDRRSSHDG